MPLPRLVGKETVLLPYTHFSVLVRLDKRLAAVTGLGKDTFHYTNAAPQAAKLNQGLELWLGMETYLLEHAADNRRRLVVYTGPIFSDLDPVYRGVGIPLRYFKVAVFIHEGELAQGPP